MPENEDTKIPFFLEEEGDELLNLYQQLDADDGKFAVSEVINSADFSGLINSEEPFELSDLGLMTFANDLSLTKADIIALGRNNDFSGLPVEEDPGGYGKDVDAYLNSEQDCVVNLKTPGWGAAPVDTITVGGEVYNVWVNDSGDEDAVVAIKDSINVEVED